MANNFNINLYKKSQQNSNSAKTPHEIVRFLMENLLKYVPLIGQVHDTKINLGVINV